MNKTQPKSRFWRLDLGFGLVLSLSLAGLSFGASNMGGTLIGDHKVNQGIVGGGILAGGGGGGPGPTPSATPTRTTKPSPTPTSTSKPSPSPTSASCSVNSTSDGAGACVCKMGYQDPSGRTKGTSLRCVQCADSLGFVLGTDKTCGCAPGTTFDNIGSCQCAPGAKWIPIKDQCYNPSCKNGYNLDGSCKPASNPSPSPSPTAVSCSVNSTSDGAGSCVCKMGYQDPSGRTKGTSLRCVQCADSLGFVLGTDKTCGCAPGTTFDDIGTCQCAPGAKWIPIKDQCYNPSCKNGYNLDGSCKPTPSYSCLCDEFIGSVTYATSKTDKVFDNPDTAKKECSAYCADRGFSSVQPDVANKICHTQSSTKVLVHVGFDIGDKNGTQDSGRVLAVACTKICSCSEGTWLAANKCSIPVTVPPGVVVKYAHAMLFESPTPAQWICPANSTIDSSKNCDFSAAAYPVPGFKYNATTGLIYTPARQAINCTSGFTPATSMVECDLTAMPSLKEKGSNYTWVPSVPALQRAVDSSDSCTYTAKP